MIKYHTWSWGSKQLEQNSKPYSGHTTRVQLASVARRTEGGAERGGEHDAFEHLDG